MSVGVGRGWGWCPVICVVCVVGDRWRLLPLIRARYGLFAGNCVVREFCFMCFVFVFPVQLYGVHCLQFCCGKCCPPLLATLSAANLFRKFRCWKFARVVGVCSMFFVFALPVQRAGVHCLQFYCGKCFPQLLSKLSAANFFR